jgi:alpha-beta hydrolase superfamily lysophospholipase
MYRGSRLAAGFLLILSGLAATAVAVFVVPRAVGDGGARWLMPIAIAFAVLHLAALVGVARGRDWGRNLAVFVAEVGGGIALLAAIATVVGAQPFGADGATGAGFAAWAAGVYAVLGIAAGRVPVLARLTPIERQRAVLGPSFAGIAHAAL